MNINIAHLYPDLLNLYGDKGNIVTLTRRLNKRGIETSVTNYALDDEIDFDNTDIMFLGGGSDREQLLVCKKLRENKNKIYDYVDKGGSLLAVCGGYQLLGKYYKLNNETIEGIELLDFYTEQKSTRIIGDIILESSVAGKIVGFENHGGRTYIGNNTPLGDTLFGVGNNEDENREGIIYKNVIGTYLHGPILPKNPRLADYIIKNAIKTKYNDETELLPIDDSLENMAHDYILNRFLSK